MTVLLRAYADNGEPTVWFSNSFWAAPMIEANGGGPFIAYTQAYGYKIVHVGTPAVTCVEFPNEGEATMFLLRWS